MIYRGFKIERVVYYGNADPIPVDDQLDLSPKQRVEYIVSETVGGYHWQEMGTTNSRSMAEEMIDRVATVREALAKVLDAPICPTQQYSCCC